MDLLMPLLMADTRGLHAPEHNYDLLMLDRWRENCYSDRGELLLRMLEGC